MVVNNELLDTRMKEVNLNYSSLASIAGIDRSTFTNIKHGKNKPSYDVMNCIVYMLKLTPIDIAEIFFGHTVLSQQTLENYHNSSITPQPVEAQTS